MTATYTFDVFSSLDGFGAAGGDWTGYWGKQGPELLDHRLAVYGAEQRMVFGAPHDGALGGLELAGQVCDACSAGVSVAEKRFQAVGSQELRARLAPGASWAERRRPSC